MNGAQGANLLKRKREVDEHDASIILQHTSRRERQRIEANLLKTAQNPGNLAAQWKHEELPLWPWQCYRSGFTGNSLPKRLYVVVDVGFDSFLPPINNEWKAESKIRTWDVSPQLFRKVLRQHISWQDADGQDFWISAFSEEWYAREYAKLWMKLKRSGPKRLSVIDSTKADICIYNAQHLANELKITIKSEMGPDIVKDEYLVLHQIPLSAVLADRDLDSSSWHPKIEPTPNLGALKYWQRFSRIPRSLPKRLYRVQSNRMMTYHSHPIGFMPESEVHPDKLSDNDFWRAVMLHLNWSKDQSRAKPEWMMFISTFSDKKHAVRWAQRHEALNPNANAYLMTIETKSLWNNRSSFHAGSLVHGMRIPLRRGLEVQQFEDEYLLPRVSQWSIIRTEKVPTDIRKDLPYGGLRDPTPDSDIRYLNDSPEIP